MSKLALKRDLRIVEAAAQTAGELVGRFAREIDQRFKVLESRFEALALVPGPPGPAGEKGSEGPPGPAGAEGTIGTPGPAGAAGEPGKPGRDGSDGKGWVPRGTFDGKATYVRLDVVAKDGASWVALTDDPGLPGDGGNWQLLMRQGKAGPEGKPGPRGEAGLPGKPGRDGTGIEDVVRGEDGRLIFVFSDGRHCEVEIA